MEGNTLPTTSMETWHPKLTPYRLLVLFTTIGLGTAKAYATSRGVSLAATTIEWIAAVVVFIIIFVLDIVELNPPRHLSFFFKSDLVRAASKLVSVTSPQYRSDEIQIPLHGPLLVTGYRLLTCTSVVLFGITKAYLGYQNLSSGSNTLDWIYGIIVVSCLYILGFYEKNPLNLMPYLFFTNYSHPTYNVLWLGIHAAGLSATLLGIKVWISLLSSDTSLEAISNASLETDLYKLAVFMIIHLLPLAFFTAFAGFLCMRILDFSLDSFLLRVLRKVFRGLFRSLSASFGTRAYLSHIIELPWVNSLAFHFLLRKRITLVLRYIPLLAILAMYVVMFLGAMIEFLSGDDRLFFIASLFYFLCFFGGFVFYTLKLVIYLVLYERLLPESEA